MIRLEGTATPDPSRLVFIFASIIVALGDIDLDFAHDYDLKKGF